jgi:sarcosine oxidase subunit alpha
VGTLGKIEIYGPDAAQLLDRVYAGRYSDLKVGMTRYGLMLDESGVIIDDGVIARLGRSVLFHHHHRRFRHGVSRVAAAQCPVGLELRAGERHRASRGVQFRRPSSRESLQKLTDIDLSDEAFPYLAARVGHVAGCRRPPAARRLRRRTRL